MLAGPEREPTPPLSARVEKTGMLPIRGLLERLKRCDALLLPYADTEWNRGITPAKIYECLATGLPIVSSKMPGLKAFDAHLYTASGPAGFAKAPSRLDDEETAKRVTARVELA